MYIPMYTKIYGVKRGILSVDGQQQKMICRYVLRCPDMSCAVPLRVALPRALRRHLRSLVLNKAVIPQP